MPASAPENQMPAEGNANLQVIRFANAAFQFKYAFSFLMASILPVYYQSFIYIIILLDMDTSLNETSRI